MAMVPQGDTNANENEETEARQETEQASSNPAAQGQAETDSNMQNQRGVTEEDDAGLDDFGRWKMAKFKDFARDILVQKEPPARKPARGHDVWH